MKPFERARVKRAQPWLGTFVEITLEGAEGTDAAFAAGFEAITQVQRRMSFHDETSYLSVLNSSPVGQWVDLDPMTAAVLQAAKELEDASQGIFNVATASRLIGCFEVQGTRARRTKEAKLDLGGIAKGFAVDLAVEAILRVLPGVSGVVNAGGDLRVFGSKSQVVHLRSETSRGPLLRTVSCSNVALATSSSRRPGEPRNHYSAQHFIHGVPYVSGFTVSVIAQKCIWADALTKIALMADPSTARRCLERFVAEAIRFDVNGSVA